MNNFTLPAVAKEMERKAARLEGEAKGLRDMAEYLKQTAAVTEPLLRAFEAAQAAAAASTTPAPVNPAPTKTTTAAPKASGK
jgi:hypothetical protein